MCIKCSIHPRGVTANLNLDYASVKISVSAIAAISRFMVDVQIMC